MEEAYFAAGSTEAPFTAPEPHSTLGRPPAALSSMEKPCPVAEMRKVSRTSNVASPSLATVPRRFCSGTLVPSHLHVTATHESHDADATFQEPETISY